MVVCACHPSYIRKSKIGGSQSRAAWAKIKTLLQNNWSKRSWRSGSSIRMLAYKVQSPEFKL
jgi:hypothetical protein